MKTRELIFRSKLYKLLSLLLQYPNDYIIGKSCRYISEILGDEETYPWIKDYLNKIKKDVCEGEVDLNDLKTMYTSLFITHYPYTLCPPYIHVYLNQDPIETFFNINKILKSLNLSIDKSFKDLRDHLAIFLELMHFLLMAEVEYSDNDVIKDIKRKIIRDYLLPVMDKFSECLEKHDKIGVYSELGSLMRRFIKYDHNFKFIS